MPSIAAVLRGEITRISRKEARNEGLPQRKASAQYRSEIAALKRRLLQLEKVVKGIARTARKPSIAKMDDGTSNVLRFSASGLVSLRRRLGLTAAQAGSLLGVSGQSIYKWEDGKTKPRASNLPAIAALRKMSKKEVAAALEKFEQ